MHWRDAKTDYWCLNMICCLTEYIASEKYVFFNEFAINFFLLIIEGILQLFLSVIASSFQRKQHHSRTLSSWCSTCSPAHVLQYLSINVQHKLANTHSLVYSLCSLALLPQNPMVQHMLSSTLFSRFRKISPALLPQGAAHTLQSFFLKVQQMVVSTPSSMFSPCTLALHPQGPKHALQLSFLKVKHMLASTPSSRFITSSI